MPRSTYKIVNFSIRLQARDFVIDGDGSIGQS